MRACADAAAHETTQILFDQKGIKDIRFSISKLFWVDLDFFPTLEERVFGTLTRWSNKAKLNIGIHWDDGNDEPLCLADILPAALGLKLEPYADNRGAPVASRRRRAEAPNLGMRDAAATEQDAADLPERQSVTIPYVQGGREKEQQWFYETPEAITIDARQDARQRPEINRNKEEYKAPYLMWLNVALPFKFIKAMFGDGGYINQRLSGKDNTY